MRGRTNSADRPIGNLLSALLLLLPATVAHGFVCEQTNGHCFHWASGNATLTSLLGAPARPLQNGTVTWDQNAVNAANDWNRVGASFQFTVNIGGPAIDPCPCPNPAGNPVIFADTACGGGLGDIVAQATQCFMTTGELASAAVFVNSAQLWNAYDGALQPTINDIRRVLLHEFGHVLGLNHPDSVGQSVAAIMNSHESDIDRLQADDIAGMLSIYPRMNPPACLGDCDSNDGVSVDEILTMVNIALGNVNPAVCIAGDVNPDGQVTVDEILRAVNNALNGCPST